MSEKIIQWVTCNVTECRDLGVIKILLEDGHTYAVCDAHHSIVLQNEQKAGRVLVVLDEDEFGTSKILEI